MAPNSHTLTLSNLTLDEMEDGRKRAKGDEGETWRQCLSSLFFAITVLEWKKPELSTDEYVFFFRERRSYEKYQHESFRGRVQLKDPEMKDGDVSVILKNVNINDTGTYECYVKVDKTTQLINTTNLTVEPGNAAGRKDGGDKDEGDKDGGEQHGRVGLVAGLSVAALLLCVFGFIIFKKRQKLIL